jgi:Domain of unknown function (DUF4136)
MCAGAIHAQNVKVDWDRMTDFTPYKTYKWTKIPTPRTPTDQIEMLIHVQVDGQLQARRLRRVEDGESDLEVGYWITLNEPKKQAAAPSAAEGAWKSGSSWSGESDARADRKGTLGIDIADRRKMLLIWRGTVMADVGYSGNDSRAKITMGLSKAFAKFPPPAK